MEICGEAASVSEAIEQVKATSPDLVIIDIQLTESHGIDLIEEIHGRYPSIKMLVVSAFDESLYAERALRAGAHGYINKRELQDNILDALRTVIAGQRYLSPQMTQQLVGQAIGGKDFTDGDPVHSLSNRELEVFELIGQGKTTGAIANQLFLSPTRSTPIAKSCVASWASRTARNLVQRAVQWVLENG